MAGPYADGSAVTAACLECHESAASGNHATTHWTWESEPVLLPGRDAPVTVGRRTETNNFCIGIQGSWTGCTKCHTGYGWEDASFDFQQEITWIAWSAPTRASTARARRATGRGSSADAAGSVRRPTRQNCGSCHFGGGGGTPSGMATWTRASTTPTRRSTSTWGGWASRCDCHAGDNHQITGHMISVSQVKDELACTNCRESWRPGSADARLNAPLTPYLPDLPHPRRRAAPCDEDGLGLVDGRQDLPEDPHVYLKIKGSFVYEHDFKPTYAWWKWQCRPLPAGRPHRSGDDDQPEHAAGRHRRRGPKIWPFKVHTAANPTMP